MWVRCSGSCASTRPIASATPAQERLDGAAGPIVPERTVGQTFLSQHRGLQTVEILLVVYDPAREIPADAQLTLSLQRADGSGTPVRVSLPAAGLAHNQKVEFAFGPLADSRNATYTLTLACAADYGLSCWQTDGESYAEGTALVNDAPQAGDLYFTTTYAYRLTDALSDLATLLWRGLPLVPAGLVLLMLPGIVLLLYLWPRHKPLDLPTYVALALALSVAFWPLVLLWTTTLGLRLDGAWIWLPVGGLVLAAAVRMWMLSNAAADENAGSKGLQSELGPETQASPRPRRACSPVRVMLRSWPSPSCSLSCWRRAS